MLLLLYDSDFVIASAIVPLIEFTEDKMGVGGKLKDGRSQVVVDVHIFVVKSVRAVRKLLLGLLSIPFL